MPGLVGGMRGGFILKRIGLDNGREIVTPWLNLDEAAVYCGRARDSFLNLARDRKCRVSGEGSGRRYHVDDLDAMLAALGGK